MIQSIKCLQLQAHLQNKEDLKETNVVFALIQHHSKEDILKPLSNVKANGLRRRIHSLFPCVVHTQILPSHVPIHSHMYKESVYIQNKLSLHVNKAASI